MWPLIAAAAIPSIGSLVGQERANRQNKQLTREGMAFEADQVAKQMQFQERMSGSAYQRATEDMRLAGINPMLAYAQGGASTPGGGAASGAAATMEDAVGPAVSSAQQGRRLTAELRNMQAQGELLNAQTQDSWAGRELKLDQSTATRAAAAEAAARTRNLNVQTRLAEYAIPQARVGASQYSGRFGSTYGVLDRLFGGRSLAPIGLRR